VAIKMTFEQPVGLKASLRKTFAAMPRDVFEAVNRSEWRSMLFSLSFLHALLVLRGKYGALGFSAQYDFSSVDFA
ncbi:dynein heavy chain domain-containing protein, partial [Baffinella frigidus]